MKEILKGQKVELTRDIPELENVLVEFDYRVNNYLKRDDFEMGTAVFLTDGSGTMTSYEDFIYSENREHPSESVKLNEREDKVYITMSKIPNKIRKIAFALTLTEYGDVFRYYDRFDYLSMRIIDLDREEVIYNYQINDSVGQNTEIVFGEMYRHNGEWKFNVNTDYLDGGLLSLGKKFGLGI